MAARPASLLCLQTSIAIYIAVAVLFNSTAAVDVLFCSVLFCMYCNVWLVAIDDSIIK
jgi:hypothetical protein